MDAHAGGDIRPVFWLVTEDGVLMGRANSHDHLLNILFPNFSWSHDATPWQHKFASGEIETTNALAELVGDDEIETKGDLYLKWVWDTNIDLAELAVVVAAEARRQGIYLSGRYNRHGVDYSLAAAEAAVASGGPDFIARWRQQQLSGSRR